MGQNRAWGTRPNFPINARCSQFAFPCTLTPPLFLGCNYNGHFVESTQLRPSVGFFSLKMKVCGEGVVCKNARCEFNSGMWSDSRTEGVDTSPCLDSCNGESVGVRTTHAFVLQSVTLPRNSGH